MFSNLPFESDAVKPRPLNLTLGGFQCVGLHSTENPHVHHVSLYAWHPSGLYGVFSSINSRPSIGAVAMGSQPANPTLKRDAPEALRFCSSFFMRAPYLHVSR